MDAYEIWLIRSRVIGLIGAVLIILSTNSLIPSIRDWEYSPVLLLAGFICLTLGLLDGFGLIQRKKVLGWIAEHNRTSREKLTSKQPWE